MSDKIFIIDFEDSFTYNIANVLYPHTEKLKVISHQDFFNSIERFVFNKRGKMAVIFGPGPGHPDQYADYFADIRRLILQKNVYTMGICLGHQLIARAHGHEVTKCTQQLHGQSVEVIFKGHKHLVQRYNSLSVKIAGQEEDILSYRQGISYQFHPESIGTTGKDIFFQELLSFIDSE